MNRTHRINARLTKVNLNVHLKRWVKRIILAVGVSATAAAFSVEVLDGAWHTSWVWNFYFWKHAHTSAANEGAWLVYGFAALSVALMATFTAYGRHKRRLAARPGSSQYSLRFTQRAVRHWALPQLDGAAPCPARPRFDQDAAIFCDAARAQRHRLVLQHVVTSATTFMATKATGSHLGLGDRPELENQVALIEKIKRNPIPQRRPGMLPRAKFVPVAQRQGEKVGRNEPCPCGSGEKFKKCGCGLSD